ncbi:MAG TPA: hypothetical protein VJ692_09365 [Nitrospiraceae bacterium]|nr:hypothetical protein [Nitrospiraceae bacterium]
MLKFFGLLTLLVLAFGLGYYTGQRPFSDVRKIVTDLSRTLLDTTVGVERNLRAHQGLVDAKAQLTQAKSDLFDRNYGSAARALGEVIANLERAKEAGTKNDHTDLNALIAKTRETRQELAAGKTVPRTRLDEIQKEVDALSAR